MQCPVDGTELMMTERSGVEIDYCPKCRGVWLDRGELDKIIERGSAEAAATGMRAETPPYARRAPVHDRGAYHDEHDEGDERDEGGRYSQPYRKKRKGFLSDLFDFD